MTGQRRYRGETFHDQISIDAEHVLRRASIEEYACALRDATYGDGVQVMPRFLLVCVLLGEALVVSGEFQIANR